MRVNIIHVRSKLIIQTTSTKLIYNTEIIFRLEIIKHDTCGNYYLQACPFMLERAVKSVIAQTCTDWNLVVVDDSPSDYELRDDVRALVEGYAAHDSRIRYVPHDRNKGVSAARNTAMRIAQNEAVEFIAYLDDDERLPQYLEHQSALMKQSGGNTALVYCGVNLCDDVNGTSQELRKSFYGSDIRRQLMKGNVIGSPSFVLIRTKYLAETEGFDPQITMGEDWDVWTRLTEHHEAAYLDEVLVNYHLGHTQREGANDKAAQKAAEAVRIQRNIRETLHVLEKNHDYFTRNKYAHWVRLSGLAVNYRLNHEPAKSFRTFMKAVKLQPSRILGNIGILWRIAFPKGLIDRWKLRRWLQNIFPRRIYLLIASGYRKITSRFF